MKLRDFLFPDAFVPQLQSVNKEGVIRELSQALVRSGRLPKTQLRGVVRALLDRERLGSTGIGKGIGIPHAKHRAVEQMMGTVGLSGEGVEFAALDGEPVYVVFLLVGPPDRPEEHLAALELVSQTLRNETFWRFLRQARGQDDLVVLLEEADAGRYGG